MKCHSSTAAGSGAAALSAGCASVAAADITGTVKLDGEAPETKEIDMAGVKECATQHADRSSRRPSSPTTKGELANVIVSIKAEDPGLGGEAPEGAGRPRPEGLPCTSRTSSR